MNHVRHRHKESVGGKRSKQLLFHARDTKHLDKRNVQLDRSNPEKDLYLGIQCGICLVIGSWKSDWKEFVESHEKMHPGNKLHNVHLCCYELVFDESHQTFRWVWFEGFESRFKLFGVYYSLLKLGFV